MAQFSLPVAETAVFGLTLPPTPQHYTVGRSLSVLPTPPPTPTDEGSQRIVYAPHITLGPVIISRSAVKQRVKSARGNRYVMLYHPLPIQTGVLSPAPRNIATPSFGIAAANGSGNGSYQNGIITVATTDPIYHTSTTGPLFGILLEVKKQWQIPIDNGVPGRIGGQYYMFHPCPETIVDVIPLHKLKPEITNRYFGTIQKLLLFRYLFGLNMSATNIYARPLLEGGVPVMSEGYPVFENFYSGNESQPFGLRSGNKGCVAVYVERKSWRFTPTLLKRYFPQAQPSAVLRYWWGITTENEHDKLLRLYSWVQRLVGNDSSYRVLPSFVYNRAVQMLLEW